MRPAAPWAFGLLLVASGCVLPPEEAGPRVGVQGPYWFETGLEEEVLGDGHYWLVRLQGTEEIEAKEGPADDRMLDCARGWAAKPQAAERRLVVNPERADLDLDAFNILILVDLAGVEFASRSVGVGCRSDVRLLAFEDIGEATVTLDHYGPLEIEGLEHSGTIEIQVFARGDPPGTIGFHRNWVLPLGLAAEVDYAQIGATQSTEYWVLGTWRLENLGAWPKDRIVFG